MELEIDAKTTSPEAAAAGFFCSEEYLSKNATNEQYVQALYRTFMGREADADGLAGEQCSFLHNRVKLFDEIKGVLCYNHK